MIRNIESVGFRRLAITLLLPVFLLLAPFIVLWQHCKEAYGELRDELPHVFSDCKDMWSKDFKACKW